MAQKLKSITFFGGQDDLISRQVLETDKYDKDAVIIVGAHLVAFLEKNGVLQGTLQSGTYSIFDKKDGIFKRFLGGSIDNIEVVYIAKTTKTVMPWGTPAPIEMRDAVADLPIQIRANGEFEVRISDPQKFYTEVVKHEKNYTLIDLQKRLLNTLMYEFRPALAKTMLENRYTFDVITVYIKEIGKSIENDLRQVFSSYGVEMTRFIINNITLPPEQKEAIENVLNQRKQEEWDARKRLEAKAEYREAMADLERMQDREFEKEKYLLDLKQRDYQTYLDVCKVIGWESNGGGNKKPAAKFCPKCGEALSQSANFCNGCGTQVNGKRMCACGTENPIGSKFCNNCGKQL